MRDYPLAPIFEHCTVFLADLFLTKIELQTTAKCVPNGMWMQTNTFLCVFERELNQFVIAMRKILSNSIVPRAKCNQVVI